MNSKAKVITRASSSINSIKALLSKDGNKELLEDFLTQFSICEAAYKVLLTQYRKEKKRDFKSSSLVIDFNEVKQVFRYFSISIDPNTLKTVFDGTRTKGQRNARGLRNSLAHKPNQDALDELASKKVSLYRAMTRLQATIINAGK